MAKETPTTPVHLNLNLVVKHEDHRSIGLHADHVDSISYTSNNSGPETSRPSSNLIYTPSPQAVDYPVIPTPVKPKLEKVFTMKDEASSLVRKGSYHKAYNLMSNKYKLRSQLREAMFLVRFNVCCVKTNHFEEATTVCVDIANLIIKYVDASASDVKAFAERLSAQSDCCFEALLFYRIAATLYEHTEPDQEKIGLEISSCVLGMRNVCSQIVNNPRSKYAQQVQCHVIPVMRDLKDKVSNLSIPDSKFAVMRAAWCEFNISHVDSLVGDLQNEENSLKSALEILQREFGSEAKQHRIYGMCLHNLAVTYYNTFRYTEASQTFKEAAACKEKAGDFECAEDKNASIRLSRRSNSILYRIRKRATSLSNH